MEDEATTQNTYIPMGESPIGEFITNATLSNINQGTYQAYFQFGGGRKVPIGSAMQSGQNVTISLQAGSGNSTVKFRDHNREMTIGVCLASEI